MSKSLVINLIGAPGTGKSTTAALLFHLLKVNGHEAELVTEFAKDLVWEKRAVTMLNQVYIFGKQHHKLFRLLDKVDFIVTDSPLILSEFYNREYKDGSEEFKNLVLHENKKFNNLNIFLNRVKPYNPNGRNQTEEESDQYAVKIKSLLDEVGIEYVTMDATSKVAYEIYDLAKLLK